MRKIFWPAVLAALLLCACTTAPAGAPAPDVKQQIQLACGGFDLAVTAFDTVVRLKPDLVDAAGLVWRDRVVAGVRGICAHPPANLGLAEILAAVANATNALGDYAAGVTQPEAAGDPLARTT